ncbi:MAG: calcium-binding protein [Planctomycetes bacterium]|nr:calcium-binding protein [Planctomycetota bacterium]
MNLFRNASGLKPLKDKHKVNLQVERLDERLVPTVTATMNVDTGVLIVNGDGGDNNIKIERAGPSGLVRVLADGQYVNVLMSRGPARRNVNPNAIEISGNGGNDTLWTDGIGGSWLDITMSGGRGDDLLSVARANYHESMLIGGTGNDILVGGRSTDHLNGNAGRDILIGGRGADFLYGGTGQDFLMPAYTDFDLDMRALRQIRDYWARTDLNYNQRVNGLLNSTAGYTGRRVNDSTVHTDSHRDEMFGDADRDRFYSDFSQDDVRDTGGTRERLTDIWRP